MFTPQSSEVWNKFEDVRSLSQVLDNHIQSILHMYNISQYIFRIFLTPSYWCQHRPQKFQISRALIYNLTLKNISLLLLISTQSFCEIIIFKQK